MGSSEREEWLKTFKICKIFEDLSVKDLKELVGLARKVYFRRSEYIFQDGDFAKTFHVVHEGLVRVFKTSSAGKSVIFTIATRGDTLNASGLSTGRHFVSAQTMRETVTLCIGKDDYFRFVRTHPNVALTVMRVMAQRLEWEYEKIVSMIGVQVESRIAHCLSMLATKFGPTLSITRRDLAEFAGTTTETTIRALGKLKRKGIIGCSSQRGEIVVSDLGGLHRCGH